MKRDSVSKIIGLSFIALILIWAMKSILFPAGFGVAINLRTNYGGGSIFMGTGLSITLLLTYLIKLLFGIFVVGLFGGLIVTAKKYIFTPEDIEAFKAPFKGGKSTIKLACKECGKEINEDWKTCPHCGTSIEKLEQ